MIKKKLKFKWHLFWSKYHYELSTVDYFQDNTQGAMLHSDKYLWHADEYVKLGGNPDDVYN